MFSNIPDEIKQYAQWVVWKLEPRPNTKPTKVPYSPLTGELASVTNSHTWGTFEQAVAVAQNYSGIGFVLTNNDPFAVIDLDDTHGDKVALERQMKVFREFNSYSEISPSGNGLHIWIKGSLPHGRRRSAIEIYSNERYMTFTGNVYLQSPIFERQALLALLFDQMGGPAVTHVYGEDKEQKETDEAIVEKASNAANGAKFQELYAGDWQQLYPSQSEADFALVDIIAFYTQNRAQIARIFRASNLGKRDKAQRNDYVAYMVNKSFDRQLPEVDVDGLRIAFQKLLQEGRGSEPGGTLPLVSARPTAETAPEQAGEGNAPAPSLSHVAASTASAFPPGLIGDVAQFIYDAAPRPVREIALAGAIGLVAGIAGRAYNVSGTGLNQYVLLLAPTGTGKEAIANGISKLMGAIKSSVPASQDFIGPGEIRSDAALLKWLSKAPAIVSTVGEFGLRLKQMSHINANSHETGLKRVLLDLYNKSGHGNTLNPIAYSDKDKNTDVIKAPSFTLLGESTPERFYEALDESMVSEGLLPRFLTLEYNGQRPPLSTKHLSAQPPFSLIERLASFCAHSLTISHGGNVHNVILNHDAQTLFDEFDKYCDSQINGASTEVIRHLWNRAHVKALKLAALCAVGINSFNPQVTWHEANWATNIVHSEVMNLLGRFQRGEVGASNQNNSNEDAQLKLAIRIITEYVSGPLEKFSKYGVSKEMHRDGVLPFAVLQRRLNSHVAFKTGRLQGTQALKQAIQTLLDASEIAEVNKNQMHEKYGEKSRAFVVLKPDRFAPK